MAHLLSSGDRLIELLCWQPPARSVLPRPQRRCLIPGKIHEILHEFLIVVAPREYPALHSEQSIREWSNYNLVAIRRSGESRHQRNANTLRHQPKSLFYGIGVGHKFERNSKTL